MNNTEELRAKDKHATEVHTNTVYTIKPGVNMMLASNNKLILQ